MSAVRQQWIQVCRKDEILADTGVCADMGEHQVAVFRVDDELFAIDNRDPASGVNVLSRGIVGDINGVVVVASPLFKHHYCLATGRCIEEPDYSVSTHAIRVIDGDVWIRYKSIDPAAKPQRRRLVVVGNGMAGMRAVEELLKIAPDLYDIEVFGAESRGNYNRILLSPVLSGEKHIDEIILHRPEWYHERGVTLHLGDRVLKIDRRRRIVKSSRGVECSYDRLLLATGSNPVVVAVPGHKLPGVLTFRDIDDVDAMLDVSRSHSRAVVIGGGLLGLEAANGLRCRGMDVTVVHLSDRLMNRQLDDMAASLLKSNLEQRGLRFKMGARTSAIVGESRVTAVQFVDGEEIPADLVVMAVGIKPNMELALSAKLRCERGILVDDTMLTFDPSIYAVGECVQHRNNTFGLVAPLWEQARVCATHLAEIGVSRFPGSLDSTHLKVTGISLFSAGNLQESAGSESLVFKDVKRGVYKRVIIENDRVRGAVLYGDTTDGPWYLELMSQNQAVGALRDSLMFGSRPAQIP